MKTKLTTIFKKSANTPPMWVCLLFALVISTNCWADVTAEWGEWGCGTSACYFPSGSSTINGIVFTEDLANCPHSGFWYGPNGPRQSECFIYPGEYAYITIPSGYTIKNISASVYNNPLKIQFCSTTSYDENNVIETKSLSNSGTSSEAVLSSTNAPTGAKSARLFSEAEVVLIRFIVTIQSEDCPKLTASFSVGNGSGIAPDNIEKCEGASFTMPGKGSMTKAGYALIGWKKGNEGDLIGVGETYPMPDGGASFTAQWEEIPAVSMPADSVKVHGTDFEVSWVIPGICDLRNYIDPYNNGSKISDQATDDSDVLSYADGIITCAGDAVGCGQHGVAFPIVPTTDVTSITIDCKGNTGFPSTHRIWGAVVNSSTKYTYWEYNSDLHGYKPEGWGDTYNSRRTFNIDTQYWTDYSGNYSTSTSIDYIAVFGNAGCSSPGYNSFSVREARYHVAGRPDIDHVVLMRTKANSDPALTDTTETSVTKRVYSGIKSYYYDEDEKEEGTTYYYTIFAVHADGTLSSRTVVGKSTAEAEKFAVTYDVNGASGDDVPASASYTAGRTFTLPLQGDLHKSGHKFGGWNDGSTTTAAGASYTMPDPGAPVSFTAVWNEFSVPTISNLAITNAANSVIPLSWSIPGICDLSRAVEPLVTPTSEHGVGEFYVDQQNYNDEGNYISVVGKSVQWSQYGAAFNIPATTDLEWISYEFKGSYSDIKVWGGVCDNDHAYWKYNTLKTLNDADNWILSGQETPDIIYWDGTMEESITDKNISQVAIYANAGGGTYDNVPFDIRNVRYHIAGQEDIHHVVLMRKASSAATDTTDVAATKLYSGTKSKFTDSEDKTPGATYYYTVFAVHADGTLSEAVSIQHEIEVVPTCTVSYENGGGTGEAPTDATEYATGHTVTLPSIGTVYKPFYAFTGWKKNNAGDLLAAGSTYTVTAEDVTAETISFTAQWTEDNTTLRIPADASLYWENKTGGSNDTKDFNNEKCVDLYTTHNVEWLAYITPGYYDISMMYGAPYYGIRGTFSIIDPSGVESDRVFYTQTDETNYGNSITKSIDIMNYDLTGLKKGKLYKIKVEHNWGGSYLCIGHINFTPVTPEEIASETVLDANNTVTTSLTEVTDVDFPGDNDQSVNLYNKKMDWVVKIAKGYYNISLLYGAPEYSTRVSVALIDPEGVEPTRWFCPDQADRNGHYHYTSGTAGTQYYSIGLDKRDLYDIDPEKTYIVRVHDEYGGSNELRVKNLTFSPIAPVEIHEEATLNASNVMVAPSIVDSRIDISNQKEAVWYATIDPHKFDITLTYFAEDGGTKVRFAIIPVGGDTIFVHQENKHNASNTTYTIPALDQDLTNISSGVYKIIVKDNYKSNGSKPQIISLTFSRSVTTHTRTGLTVGNYGTICLPYAVAAEDRNGADLFEIDEWDPNGASLTLSQLTNNENMVAGRPYIFQATEATATFRYYAEGDEAAAGSNNGLVGSYVQALIPQNDDNYIIYNNKLYLVNSDAYVGANRAYIHKQDQVQPAPAYRRRVTLSVNGAQVATDIDLINDPAQMTKYIENGHLFIFRDGKLYNAQGQLVK